MAIDFDEDSRGLERYRQLETDVRNGSIRITDSLPIFCRIVITEGGGGTRWREFNKYDLLNPVCVPHAFPTREAIGAGWAAADFGEKIVNGDALSVDDFMRAGVVDDGRSTFSVDQVVKAVAYSRGIHNTPSDPALSHLYQGFFKDHPRRGEALLRAIARALVDAYAPVYENFVDPSANMFCRVPGHQPRIVTAGVLDVDGAIYDNAYSQIPLRVGRGEGVRICLRIKLLDENGRGGYIAAVGHRSEPCTRVFIRHVGRRIVVARERKFGGPVVEARVDLSADMTSRHIVLEAAAYSRGRLIVAIDESLKLRVDAQSDLELAHGKVIVGADLDGENGARFQLESVLIERLGPFCVTAHVHCSNVLRQPPPYEPTMLSAGRICRPCLLARNNT